MKHFKRWDSNSHNYVIKGKNGETYNLYGGKFGKCKREYELNQLVWDIDGGFYFDHYMDTFPTIKAAETFLSGGGYL